jgi:hypothetical protein
MRMEKMKTVQLPGSARNAAAHRWILAFAFLCATVASSAQEFSILKLELLSDGVAVHYDLIDTTRNRTYTVHMYSSIDQFLAPLEKIKGDVGLQVKPGRSKKVVWNTREEFGPQFNGDVQLEIRGHVYVPFLMLDKFKDVQVRNRGFLVKWSGGQAHNILNFQLHRADGKLEYALSNVANASETKIVIPSSVKPGKDYYFRISDSKNKDQVVESQRFQIRRKYPLVSKVALIAIAGFVIYELLPEKDKIVEGPPGLPND